MMTYSEATKAAKENKGISYKFESSSESGQAFAFWCTWRKRVVCIDAETLR